MSQLRCPICGAEFDPATSEAPPFCTPRCRQIDLGRWLDERYPFPSERGELDPDEPPADSDTSGGT